MAPPKWSVFDGIAENDDERKPGDETGATDPETAAVEAAQAGEEDTSAGETDTQNTEEKEDESAPAGEGTAGGEDPGAGDGDKPDKKELLVCAGAMCTCTQAVSPAPVKLNVLTQHTNYINDPDGTQKLVATDKEQDITALNFVSCKFPDPSKPRPCNPKLLWKDFYEAIVLREGAHPLTEKSTAFCSLGQGTVAIKMTGQQSTVTPAQVAAANSALWATENPLLDENAAGVEMEEDKTEGDEKGVGVRAIKAKGGGTYPVGSWVVLEATELSKARSKCTEAELQGINWTVYDEQAQVCNQAIDAGPETQIRFGKAGSYTVEGYGVAPGGAKAKKGSALAHVRIEENRLAGIKTRVANRYRFTEPAVFELSTLFPVAEEPLPRGQRLDKVAWELILQGGPGVPTLVAAGGSATVTCTGPCTYVVIATLGQKAEQSEKMQAIANRVVKVVADKRSCRPGEEVVFKAAFELEPALPAETAVLQWKSEGPAEGLLPGRAVQRLKFTKEGTYKVYAFMHAPSKSVVAEVQVTQPKLKSVIWMEEDNSKEKRLVGFDEKAKLRLVFESAQDLEMEVQIGTIREDRFVHLGAPFSFKVNASNTAAFDVKFPKSSFENRLKEGDVISAQLKCVTPGRSVTAAGIGMPRLLFTKEEKLLGIAFFKGGQRVTQVAYGDKLTCRVYGRNLSAGKDGVAVRIYRLESRMGFDNLRADSLMHEAEKVVIGDRGYGEFDFVLDQSKAGNYEGALHYFWAQIEENEYFGGQELEVRKEGNGMLLVAQLPVKEGEGQDSKAGIEKGEKPVDGKCVCKEYDLIWGSKVSCAFRKKVVEICKELWPANFMEMANGLMAVMAAETNETFAAHQIMGKPLKPVDKVEMDDFFMDDNKKSSRAVGLIQFTQQAIIQLGDFVKGDGFQKLHEVKLKYAQMGEERQLEEKVKAYFKLDNANKRIKNPGDIYLHVFAPIGVGKSDDTILYEKFDNPSSDVQRGSDEGFTANKSVDRDGNKDGKIQRREILKRYQNNVIRGNHARAINYSCIGNSNIEKNLKLFPCFSDFSQCIRYSDVVETPRLNNQSNNANKNRFRRVPRYNNEHPGGYFHTGVDILAPIGTPLKSLLCGKIVKAEDTGSALGKIVIVKSKEKSGKYIWLEYCHMSEVSVKTGQYVCHGEVIGKAGKSGNASTIDIKYHHVHIEASTDGVFKGGHTRVDPEQFMHTKFDDTIFGNPL